MTKKEYINRSIGLTFDFIRAVVDHPETLEKIPRGVRGDFLKFFKEKQKYS
jgi:hypothetical protein